MPLSKINYSLPQKKIEYLRALNKLLGTQGWFIAGSFANFDVAHPGDIDIFFVSEQDFLRAHNKVNKAQVLYLSSITKFAHTYLHNGSAFTARGESSFLGTHLDVKPIQLITRHFGGPQTIFDDMDLNVCKRAILSTGEYVEDCTASLPLHITKKHVQSYQRFIKYLFRLDKVNISESLLKKVVDENIADNSILVDYYNDTDNDSIPKVDRINNFRMYEDFSELESLRPYLKEQAEKYAPELLI